MVMNKFFMFATLLTTCFISEPTKDNDIINAGDYGLSEDQDATPVIYRALLDCRKKRAKKLVIPKGTYHFYPDRAHAGYRYISNNDKGVKRFAFLLEEFKDFEINGNGSNFIFHGEMLPFDIDNSRNITLTDFTIDWNKPFYFQGKVVEVDKRLNSFDLEVFEEIEYEIRGNELFFMEKIPEDPFHWLKLPAPLAKNKVWEQDIRWNIWFDPQTKAPLYQGGRYALEKWNEKLQKPYTAKEIKPGIVRLKDAAMNLPKEGWVLIIKGKKSPNRTSPAIHLADSENLTLKDITIHHAGGMGLIAEKCTDIHLDNFNVLLPPNSGRLVTTTADATHFVNCRGAIEIKNSTFENMLDDASNIHGIYTRVYRRVNKKTLGIMRMHSQQLGFNFTGIGDTLQIVDHNTLVPKARLIVTDVEEFNPEYFQVTFSDALPAGIEEGDAVNNLSWQPDFHMHNSIVRNNRARSILISTSGEVLIENNLFSNCSHFGILLAGDATFWYESGPVKDVMIRNNIFRNMGLFAGNFPIIRSSPRIQPLDAENFYYHRNIIMQGNEVNTFSKTLVDLNSVHNFQFLNNKITRSNDFPLSGDSAPVFKFNNSEDIRIEGNQYLWEGKKATIDADPQSTNIILKNNCNIKK